MELYQRFEIPEVSATMLINEAVKRNLDVNGFYALALSHGVVPDYMPDDLLGRVMVLFSVAFSHPDKDFRDELLSLLSDLPSEKG